MLDVRSVVAAYGNAVVLSGVDLVVPRGSVTVLVGSNGAGKTSLLRAVIGTLAVRRGEIRLDGREITELPTWRRIELGLALVPEGRRLFPWLSVEDNLKLGAITQRARRDAEGSLERAYELFPRLYERRRQRAGTLSGGEQQILAIARALVSKPTLLILDEPSLGLAPVLVRRVIDIVQTIHGAGTTILLVEQNVEQSLEIADKAYVIENGRVVLSGSGRELLGNERVRHAYLGL
jgi:branched-chain amino acid transport system ATP-binding protein